MHNCTYYARCNHLFVLWTLPSQKRRVVKKHFCYLNLIEPKIPANQSTTNNIGNHLVLSSFMMLFYIAHSRFGRSVENKNDKKFPSLCAIKNPISSCATFQTFSAKFVSQLLQKNLYTSMLTRQPYVFGITIKKTYPLIRTKTIGSTFFQTFLWLFVTFTKRKMILVAEFSNTPFFTAVIKIHPFHTFPQKTIIFMHWVLFPSQRIGKGDISDTFFHIFGWGYWYCGTWKKFDQHLFWGFIFYSLDILNNFFMREKHVKNNVSSNAPLIKMTF